MTAGERLELGAGRRVRPSGVAATGLRVARQVVVKRAFQFLPSQ